MTELADIKMTLKPNGMGEVLVNGEDISGQIVSAGVQFRPGQPLVLNLQQITGAMTIEGQGIVNVAGPGDDKQAILKFLDRLDPLSIEQEVLKQGDLGTSIMASAIEIIRGMVK